MKVGDSVIVFGIDSTILDIKVNDIWKLVHVVSRINNRTYTHWVSVEDINPPKKTSKSSKINYVMTVSLSSVLVGQLAISSGINILLSTIISLTVGVALILNTKEK